MLSPNLFSLVLVFVSFLLKFHKFVDFDTKIRLWDNPQKSLFGTPCISLGLVVPWKQQFLSILEAFCTHLRVRGGKISGNGKSVLVDQRNEFSS